VSAFPAGVAALARSWRPALLSYVGRGEEEALLLAHGLGRTSVAGGIGVLELLAVHQEVAAGLVLEAATCPGVAPDGSQTLEQVLRRCDAFVREAVVPYEMAWRGYASG